MLLLLSSSSSSPLFGFVLEKSYLKRTQTDTQTHTHMNWRGKERQLHDNYQLPATPLTQPITIIIIIIGAATRRNYNNINNKINYWIWNEIIMCDFVVIAAGMRNRTTTNNRATNTHQTWRGIGILESLRSNSPINMPLDGVRNTRFCQWISFPFVSFCLASLCIDCYISIIIFFVRISVSQFHNFILTVVETPKSVFDFNWLLNWYTLHNILQYIIDIIICESIWCDMRIRVFVLSIKE